MSLDKKLRYLFVALLLMAGFYYVFERPGIFWEQGRGLAGKSGPDEQFGCWIGDLRGGSGESDQGKTQEGQQATGGSATEGETPDWFKNLATDEKKNEPDADMIARARELQEEQWSREISKSPRAKLLNTTISDARLPALNFNDTTVAGTTFINCKLPDFKASGVTFKNVRFHQVEMDKARFTDCVFENCTFENARMDDAILKETVFKGGAFRMVSVQTARALVPPGIYRASFEKVTFDGTAFHDSPLSDADGEITMRNLKDVRFKSTAAPLVHGAGLKLRLENSTIDGAWFASVSNSKLYISGSSFIGGSIKVMGGTLLAEKSVFQGDNLITASGLALVRQSRLSSASVDKGRMFIVDCEFPSSANSPAKFQVLPTGELYCVNNTGEALQLTNYNKASLSGLKLKHLTLEGGLREQAATLNLKDVSAEEASINPMKLKGGDWLNVSLPRVKSRVKPEDLGELKLKDVHAPFLEQLYEGKLPVVNKMTWEEIKLPEDGQFTF